jgi:putative PEP-CTERM system histidine kinase
VKYYAEANATMTNAAFVTATVWSYGLAALGCFAFAVRAGVSAGTSIRRRLLLTALATTAAWSCLCLSLAFEPPFILFVAERAANALRYGAWFAFLAALVIPSGKRISSPSVAAIALWLVASAIFAGGLSIGESVNLGPRVGFAFQLGMGVFGLLLVEQLVRRVPAHRRWGIKPLVVALAGIFGFDVFLAADALLYGRLDPDIWLARGVANVVVIPFIAVATARNTGWTVDLHVSRKAIFHSTALLLSGLFLLAIATAGYFVRYAGGQWGRALAIEFLFVALLLAALVGASGRFRSRLRVFVSKHFFTYRYDYREEWLRFTRTLSNESATHGVQQSTIVALASLVESPGGAMWLHTDTRGYVQSARWNSPASHVPIPLDDPLVAFLERTGWIVSIPEWRRCPSTYPGVVVPPPIDVLTGAWLVAPLASAHSFFGFVVLSAPLSPIVVDWEVRDLLKTASRQAASFIGELRATEALLEARKFEAFNHMSAFVVHDLKNLVAQLSLMLRNADKHGENPRFQLDMRKTVENVVERMNRLMLQLRAGVVPVDNPRSVNLAPMLARVCAAKRSDNVIIHLDVASGIAALGHEDRLEHVFGHLVQNAIDACGQGGNVIVRVEQEPRYVIVVVADDGQGMSAEFVRERLFKPFQSTKVTGMGIGVYESLQYVCRIGGEMRVESAVGEGTRIRVRLRGTGLPANQESEGAGCVNLESEQHLKRKAQREVT